MGEGIRRIIHDECSADIKDADYVGNILNAHKNGLPAVNLHGAMHSYRTGDDLWFSFLGLESTRHAWKKPIDIDFSAAQHPFTHGLKNWTTLNEELYNSIKIFDTATPLVLGSQVQSNGKTETLVVAWTNNFHGTRIFSTTLGHENATVADDRYLDLVVRGLLWTCDKLNSDFLKPYQSKNGRFETVAVKVAETPK